MDYEMNNKKLNYITDIVRRYPKNYLANNPNWDHPTPLKKIKARVKREEDFKTKLSHLEGEMEDATSFEDDKEWTDWLSKRMDRI